MLVSIYHHHPSKNILEKPTSNNNNMDNKQGSLGEQYYLNLNDVFNDINNNDNDDGFGGFMRKKVKGVWNNMKRVVIKAWEMGRSDPRKVVFSAKLGLALALISLLILWKEPFPDISQHYVWAILTVVIVFEFSIGATFSKGLNRGLGTLSAAGLALAMAELARFCERAGDVWDEVVIVASLFTIGSLATFAKLYPALKAYEYGFILFTLTYVYIMASGYRASDFIDTAISHFLLIALGAVVSVLVNVGIYPIWAGEDLHNLVVKNFIGVANSLEGCINQYLNCVEYARIPQNILTYQAHEDPLYTGYRSAVESKSQEDTLLGFAIWEPPHGSYKLYKFPWRNFVKVSGALRHCSFMVMALHGCILSEIQAPAERRQVFHDELQRVGTAGANVLRELGNKVMKMEKLGWADILCEVHEAAEDLQKKVDKKSYLLVDPDNWDIGEPPSELHDPQEDPQDFINIEDPYLYNEYYTLRDPGSASNNLPWEGTNGHQRSLSRQFSYKPERMMIQDQVDMYKSASVLSLVTFTSLLIEFVARLQNLVSEFEELSEKAKFKARPNEEKVEEEICGVWTRLWRHLKPRNRNDNLLD